MTAGAPGPADLAFVHTSSMHVATFEALLQAQAPGRRAVHRVHEDLLARARRDGVDAPDLAAAVQAAILAAAGEAQVVVCTCSTLGGLAEATPAAVPVTRIDRAMADEAVRRGAPVLVVAALQSTLLPTDELLASSARRLGLPLQRRSLWVSRAWAQFEAGALDAYADTLVDAVRRAVVEGETVVLAQASMAPVAGRLADHGITALASPGLGVAHALRLRGA